jgi:hypothetical protein
VDLNKASGFIRAQRDVNKFGMNLGARGYCGNPHRLA